MPSSPSPAADHYSHEVRSPETRTPLYSVVRYYRDDLGRLWRVKVVRNTGYQDDSYAQADVLTRALTWTTVVETPGRPWVEDTPKWSGDDGKQEGFDALAEVADALYGKAYELTPRY